MALNIYQCGTYSAHGGNGFGFMPQKLPFPSRAPSWSRYNYQQNFWIYNQYNDWLLTSISRDGTGRYSVTGGFAGELITTAIRYSNGFGDIATTLPNATSDAPILIKNEILSGYVPLPQTATINVIKTLTLIAKDSNNKCTWDWTIGPVEFFLSEIFESNGYALPTDIPPQGVSPLPDVVDIKRRVPASRVFGFAYHQGQMNGNIIFTPDRYPKNYNAYQNITPNKRNTFTSFFPRWASSEPCIHMIYLRRSVTPYDYYSTQLKTDWERTLNNDNGDWDIYPVPYSVATQYAHSSFVLEEITTPDYIPWE